MLHCPHFTHTSQSLSWNLWEGAGPGLGGVRSVFSFAIIGYPGSTWKPANFLISLWGHLLVRFSDFNLQVPKHSMKWKCIFTAWDLWAAFTKTQLLMSSVKTLNLKVKSRIKIRADMAGVLIRGYVVCCCLNSSQGDMVLPQQTSST